MSGTVEAEQVIKASQVTRSTRRQDLRKRRFAFAGVFSVVYVIVLAVFCTQDKADPDTLLHAGAFVAVFIAIFYWLFRTRFNVRFSDPSLTAAQFLAATFTMLYVGYRAPETRLVFAAFFYVALMFGMLRRNSRDVAVLGSVSIVIYLALAGARYVANGDQEVLRLDVLQCFTMAVTFPWVVFLGGHMQRIEKGLSDARVKLVDIEEKARRDELTGIYNRRALMAAMQDTKQRADSAGEPFSMCVIDIDWFKRYNDEFDHLTGDSVLRRFAQAVQNGLRTTDFFGRYGGEEFVQIMPNTTLAGAMADAERLRQRIRALELAVSRDVGPLTVSIGVAEYAAGETIDQIFARADRALYKAKKLGRDRVVC